MVVERNEIVTVLTVDARDLQAKAAAVSADIDKVGASLLKLAGAPAVVEEKLNASAKASRRNATELETLLRQIDPVYAAHAKLAAEQDKVKRGLETLDAQYRSTGRSAEAVQSATNALVERSKVLTEIQSQLSRGMIDGAEASRRIAEAMSSQATAANAAAKAQAALLAQYREQAALASSTMRGQAMWNAYAGVSDGPTVSAAASASVFQASIAEQDAVRKAAVARSLRRDAIEAETRALEHQMRIDAAALARKEADAVQALRDKINPLAAAERQYAQAVAETGELRKKGLLTHQEEQQALALHRANLQKVADAHGAVGHAAEISAGQMSQARQIVTSNLLNVGNVAVATKGDLVSMVSPLPDLVYGLRLMGGSVATVATAAAALAVGIGGLLAVQQAYLSSIKEVANAHRAMGGAVGLSNAQFEAMAQRVAEASDISVRAAREQQAMYIRTGDIGAQTMERLIGLSRDYAAATQQDLAAASGDLASLFKDPVAGAEKLAASLGLLTGKEVEYIRQLRATGQEEQARLALSDALNARVKGMGDQTTTLAHAWERVARAISNAFDAAGKATATETNAQAIARLEARRQQLLQARGLNDARVAGETGGATGGDAVPVDPRFSAPGMVSGDLAAVDAELARRRAQAARDRENAAKLADYRTQSGYSIDADAIARSARPLAAEITAVTEKITKLERGLGTNMMGASAEGQQALEGYRNQLSDLQKVAVSGLDLETYKRQELAKVQQKYAGMVGPQYEAQKAAEIERINLIGTATTAAQRGAQVDAARTQVIAGQTAAIAQQAAQYSVQVQGLMGVADAYRVSTAAGIEATARQQAMTDALSMNVDVATRTRELVIQGAAQQAASSAQAVDALSLEVKAQEDVAAAARGGVAARIEAERQAQVAKQTHILLAQAEAAEAQGATELALRLRVLAEGYDDLSKRAAKADLSKSLSAYGEQLATQRRGLDLEASLVGKPDNIRAMAKAHAQINELLISRGKTYEELTDKERTQVDLLRQQATENATLEAGIARQQEAWSTLTGSLERAFDRVGDAIVEAMVSGQSETIEWGKITKSIIASIVADLAKLAIANPIKNALFGTNSGTLFDLPMFGGRGMSGGQQYVPANQNGGGFSLSSMPSINFNGMGGSFFGDLGMGWMTQPIAPNGLFGGPPAAMMEGIDDIGQLGYAAGGLDSIGNAMTPLGAIGAGLSVLNFAMNPSVGSGVGAAGSLMSLLAPAGSALGPIGMALAVAAPLLDGLFAPDPSTEYAGAWVQRDASGRVINRASGADQTATGKVSGLEKAAEVATSATISTLRSAGLTMTGGLWLGAESDTEGNRFKLGGWDGKVVSSSTDTAQVVADVMRALAQDGSLSGNADVLLALKNSKATDAQGLAADLDLARSFRPWFEAMTTGGELATQIKSMMDAAKEAGEQARTQLIEWRDKVVELGLATKEELTPALRNSVEAMMGLGPTVEPLRGLAAVTKQAEIQFEELRPILEEIGYTAAEQSDLLTRATQKAVDAYNQQVADVQRRGTISVMQAVDPNYRMSGSDLLFTQGLDATKFPNFVIALDGFLSKANAGTATINDLWAAQAELNQRLQNGRIGAEEYNTILGHLTQSYQTGAQAAQQAAEQHSNAMESLWSKVVSEARNAAQQAADAFGKAGDTLASTRLGLLTNPQLSPLSLEDRRAEAFRQLYEAAATAKGSDQDKALAAMAAIPQLAQVALQASRDFNASGPAYATDFDTISGILASTETVAQRQANLAREQVNKLDRLIGVTDSGLSDVEAALRDTLSKGDFRDYGTGSQGILNRLLASALPNYKGGFAGGEFEEWAKAQAPAGLKVNAKNPSLNAILVALGAPASGFGNAGWQGYFRGLSETDPRRIAARELLILNGYRQPDFGFEDGGLIPGGVVGNGIWGKDSVLARYDGGGMIALAGGEGVLTAEATAAIGGAAAVDFINANMRLPANDRFVAPNVMEFRRPAATDTKWDDSRLIARVDRLIEVNTAVLQENVDQRAELVRMRAENARLRRELADAKMKAPRTGTY